jgi:Rrf2 family iron-sulfur cluster assembly transcriptional regulator
MRLELSKRTDLALRALLHLCGDFPNTLLSGTSLAEAIGTSKNYLPQVMAPLIRSGWVESVPGPSGGYRLLTPANAITLLTVIEAVEGPTQNGTCVLRGAPCPVEEPCVLHVPWSRARDALLSELDRTPVTEVDCRALTQGG